MVGVFEGLGGFLFADDGGLLEGLAEHVGGVESDGSLGADDDEGVGGVAKVGEVELGEAVAAAAAGAGEAEGDGDGVVEVLAEAGVGVFGADGGDDFGGLGGEDVAGGVDGVGAHVKDGAGEWAGVGAVVFGVDHLGEVRAEEVDFAELAGADFGDGVEGGGLKVEAVGDHEFGGGGFSGGEDFVAFFGGDFEGFFGEDVDAGLEGGDDEFGVAPVGGGEIDGVEGAGGERLGELLVGVGGGDVVFFAELGEFLWVGGDEGGHFGVAGVVDAGHHVFLGDVAEADDGVADFRCVCGEAERFHDSHVVCISLRCWPA